MSPWHKANQQQGWSPLNVELMFQHPVAKKARLTPGLPALQALELSFDKFDMTI